MHTPHERTARETSAVADLAPPTSFLRLSASTLYCDNGPRSFPYQTLVRPGILPGSASVALKNDCQSASLAVSIGVNAKQCISFFSPAERAPASRTIPAK